jgi:hypothetical protein
MPPCCRPTTSAVRKINGGKPNRTGSGEDARSNTSLPLWSRELTCRPRRSHGLPRNGRDSRRGGRAPPHLRPLVNSPCKKGLPPSLPDPGTCALISKLPLSPPQSGTGQWRFCRMLRQGRSRHSTRRPLFLGHFPCKSNSGPFAKNPNYLRGKGLADG